MPPKAAGHAVVVPIDKYSDGDFSHRPVGDQYSMITPDIYLEKLARQWMEDENAAESGKRYVLDRLPKGYALFGRMRPGVKHQDKYLYGHPSHKIFDSPARFYPHFKWLMEHGQSDTTCSCTVCANAKSKGTSQISGKVLLVSHAFPWRSFATRLPKIETTKTTAVKGKEKQKARYRGPADLEGTPDVITALIEKLEQRGIVDEPVQEPQSMDWRAERTSLPARIRKESTQYSFIPRIGELVLWVREISGEIIFDKKAQEFRMQNIETGQDYGLPEWMAGVVGQVAEESVLLEDLLMETAKDFNVNMSGFRVECFPDPNDGDREQKGYSKQYRYVPLNHIRPFNFWRQYLKESEEKSWHPSIKHALTVMSSLSLVEKYRFKGTWPNATVFCRGIYIGAEVVYVGDTIRLMPPQDEIQATDILKITSIRLRLLNLNHQHDEDTAVNDNYRFSIVLYLVGKAYTSSRTRAYKNMAVSPIDLAANYPKGMRGYKVWYYLHDPHRNYLVSKDRVLGRCFEADAMTMWFGRATIDVGLESVRMARRYSSANDKRIQNSDKTWYWGETRVDVLDLETLNGLNVGRFDDTRDPALWRKLIPAIDGVAGKAETVEAAKASAVVAPVSPFKANKNSIVMEGDVQVIESEESSEMSEHVQDRHEEEEEEEEEEEAEKLIDDLVEGIGFGPRVDDGGDDYHSNERKVGAEEAYEEGEDKDDEGEGKVAENKYDDDDDEGEDQEGDDKQKGQRIYDLMRAGAKRLKLNHLSG